MMCWPACSAQSGNNSMHNYSSKADSVLSLMTLDEKIGQLNQYTGNWQATVGVGATDDGKSVHSVVVIFDESSEWNTLVNTYDYYKGLYIRKYGEPSACREHNPSRQDSNISLMYELGQGTVTYASAWNVTGGTIELSIEKAGYSDGVVIIRYRDAQNVENKIQKDLEDI